MNSPIDCSKVRFAIQAVREAAQLVRQVQRELVTAAISKDDKSPVTVADFAAQAIVSKRLLEAFPEMGFVGEESSEVLRTPAGQETLEQITHFVRRVEPTATPEEVCAWIDRGAGEATEEFWTLDPVDGTKGFLRGDQYAVALAFIRDGQVRVGALGCPELGEGITPNKGGLGTVVVSRRESGCFASSLADENSDWKKLAVSDESDISAARMLRSVEKAHTDTGGIGELVTALGILADPVGMDSQAKYAVLAAGGGEINLRLLSPSRLEYREKIWDQAAGSICVQEAGGRVSDLDGKPLDFSHGRILATNRGVLATNGHLHEAVLAGLKTIGA
ncbi:3'(2'),5'-bisphosphate nucleotidase [Bythopirellula polymerisocia]|uniref:3'(2'),5'-bisphosphate nucleotidase n=1 Tax=Bythopirellula polymerisocia TaxID=2528003 RepID=A0A5C6CW36_9BACT|nr:3'(2'),5'-bisphosphate nucleotidase [Bythopirellula polymerisocia]TWU28608.1 Inositol-1-monophosphatase [Bythopirellula polymerisocia]